MSMFGCFSPLHAAKNKESRGLPKTMDGDKRSSKINSRVKPIDVVCPSILQVSKKKRNKLSLRAKPTDIIIPSIEDGSKKRRSKWGLLGKPTDSASPSPEDGSKKRRSKWGLRVKHIDIVTPSTENGFKVLYSPSSESFPSFEKVYDDTQPKGELAFHESNSDLNSHVLEKKTETDEGNTIDSWMQLITFMESPLLKRSCSSIEIKQIKQLMGSSSYKVESIYGPHSIHVLPWRGEKIWWKLFLWSHGNLHRSSAPEIPVFDLSDTNKAVEVDNMKNKAVEVENQWTAFSLESSHMDRVNAWVNSLVDCSFHPIDVEEHSDEVEGEKQTADGHGVEIGEFSVKKYFETCQREMVDMRSIGLKVVPSISGFLYLRSVNLSGNCIVQISPGSLPKSLRILDLSRNKITNIEGLRHLEKLRVLDLSFNRISKISHGLSSCSLIKELYLAGNKISVVECLHRVQKLTVLDLSFNKITTTKALSQLVANYHCLLSLNLTGNPVQANIGNDQLKREVLSLLPHVSYLNKQPIKPGLAKIQMNKPALGDGRRRKRTRRSSLGSSPPSKRRFGRGSFRSIKYSPKSTHSSSGRVNSVKLRNGYFSVTAVVPSPA